MGMIEDAIMPGKLAIEFLNKARLCCLETADKWPMWALGQQRKCKICENSMKTVQIGMPMEGITKGGLDEIDYRKRLSVEPSEPVSVFVLKSAAQGTDLRALCEVQKLEPLSVEKTAEITFSRLVAPEQCKPQLAQRLVRLGRGIFIELGEKLDGTKGDVTKTEHNMDVSPCVELTKDGTCPATHPVKWAGKCWTLRAAAQGFPDKDCEKQIPPAQPVPPPTIAPPAIGEAEKVIAERLRNLAERIEAGAVTGAAITAELKQIMALLPKERGR